MDNFSLVQLLSSVKSTFFDVASPDYILETLTPYQIKAYKTAIKNTLLIFNFINSIK